MRYKSSIHGIGKTQIIGNVSRTAELCNFDKFYKDDTTCTTIGESPVRFFEFFFFSPAENYNNRIIMNMIPRDRSTIDPYLLLSSSRAACFGEMRVFLQILVWRRLPKNYVIFIH